MYNYHPDYLDDPKGVLWEFTELIKLPINEAVFDIKTRIGEQWLNTFFHMLQDFESGLINEDIEVISDYDSDSWLAPILRASDFEWLKTEDDLIKAQKTNPSPIPAAPAPYWYYYRTKTRFVPLAEILKPAPAIAPNPFKSSQPASFDSGAILNTIFSAHKAAI